MDRAAIARRKRMKIPGGSSRHETMYFRAKTGIPPLPRVELHRVRSAGSGAERKSYN